MFFYLIAISLSILCLLCGHMASEEIKRRIFNFVEERIHLMNIFWNPNLGKMKEPSGEAFSCPCGHQAAAPGVSPRPSDQGSSETCTLHAISKAIVSFLDKKQIDVDQDKVLDVLETCIGTQKRIWPSCFNNKGITVHGSIPMSNNELDYDIKLKVVEVAFDVMVSVQIPDSTFEYILCTSALSPQDLHSVYVEKKQQDTLTCINSWGRSYQPNPVVLIQDYSNKFFELEVQIIKTTLPGNINDDLEENNNKRCRSAEARIVGVLSNIKVQGKKCKQFLEQLKDECVQVWKESSHCKVVTQIQPETYPDFIEHFKTSMDINNDKVIAVLKDLNFAGGSQDMIKFFHCKKTEITGCFGMVVAIKNPEGSIDVAYAVYDVEMKFAGSRNVGLFTQGVAVIQDVMFRKNSDKRMALQDVSELSENYILERAMTAFYQAGYIPNIVYCDQDNSLTNEA